MEMSPQPLNADAPIDIKLSGTVTLTGLPQLQNAEFPIDVVPLGIVMQVKL